MWLLDFSFGLLLTDESFWQDNTGHKPLQSSEDLLHCLLTPGSREAKRGPGPSQDAAPQRPLPPAQRRPAGQRQGEPAGGRGAGQGAGQGPGGGRGRQPGSIRLLTTDYKTPTVSDCAGDHSLHLAEQHSARAQGGREPGAGGSSSQRPESQPAT